MSRDEPPEAPSYAHATPQSPQELDSTPITSLQLQGAPQELSTVPSANATEYNPDDLPPEYTPRAGDSIDQTALTSDPGSYPEDKKVDLSEIEPEIIAPAVDRGDDSLTREPLVGHLDHDPNTLRYSYHMGQGAVLPDYDSEMDFEVVDGVTQMNGNGVGAATDHIRREDAVAPLPEHALFDERGGKDLGELNVSLGEGERVAGSTVQTDGWDTKAKVQDDGRVGITLSHIEQSVPQSACRMPSLTSIATLLRHKGQLLGFPSPTEQQTPPSQTTPAPEIPFLNGLNIVMQIVGSRGDVQPFLSLALVLSSRPYNNRIRMATHECFRSFVGEVGEMVPHLPPGETQGSIEFFPIGGDPHELMSFMVKNPGLMPSMETVRSGEIRRRRNVIWEILLGGWAACVDRMLPTPGTAMRKPFVADVIIANPPGFGHLHCAERLGIPLHLMFTMPWTSTQAFPHPLANIQPPKQSQPSSLLSSSSSPSSSSSSFSGLNPGMVNFLSYSLVEMITWQGAGDLINRFREKVLGLEPLSSLFAPGLIARLKIPYTYCWSPSLIPKPSDWGEHCSVSGFWFLDLAKGANYEPPPELTKFLSIDPITGQAIKREDERPVVYIGFGSIVVDEPKRLTELVLRAIKMCNIKAVVSKGWGTISPTPEDERQPGIFYIDAVPHDWLFNHVDAVVHHGGAGTTAAAIRAGKPNVIIPFFGDQMFWGNMVHKAGAGPSPVPYNKQNEGEESLTSEILASMIVEAVTPGCRMKAAEMGEVVQREDGQEIAAADFTKRLGESVEMSCAVSSALVKLNSSAGLPRKERIGSLSVKHSKHVLIRISPAVAITLIEAGVLEEERVRISRYVEYETGAIPFEPITGATGALLGTIGSVLVGLGVDFPREVWRGLAKKENEKEMLAGVFESVKESQSRLLTEGSSASGDKNDGGSANAGLGGSVPLLPSSGQATTEDQSASSRLVDQPSSHLTSPSPSLPPSTPSLDTRPKTPATPSSPPSETLSKTLAASASSLSRVLEAGLKSPLDFTMALHHGFHNAPKLYGDSTVRKADKVTGFHSGLKAAGKELTFGFYDGVTGLVTQPIRGAKEEGVLGALKGFGKGIGGLVLKPYAGIWGLPGYVMVGVHEEVKKMFASGDDSVEKNVKLIRLAEGRQEFLALTEEEKREILLGWEFICKRLEEAEVTARKGLLRRKDNVKQQGSEVSPAGDKLTRQSTPNLLSPSESPVPTKSKTMSSILASFSAKKIGWDQRRAERVKCQKQKKKLGKKNKYEEVSVNPDDYQYNLDVVPLGQEIGPRRSENTSPSIHGLLPEGYRTVQEQPSLVQRPRQGVNDEEDEELQRIIKISTIEYQKEEEARLWPRAGITGTPSLKSNQADIDREEQEMIEKAIKASVEEYKMERRKEMEEEALLARASLSADHTDGDSNARGTLTGFYQHPDTSIVDREAEELERAIRESLGASAIIDPQEGSDTEDDEEFKKALAESMKDRVKEEGELYMDQDMGLMRVGSKKGKEKAGSSPYVVYHSPQPSPPSVVQQSGDVQYHPTFSITHEQKGQRQQQQQQQYQPYRPPNLNTDLKTKSPEYRSNDVQVNLEYQNTKLSPMAIFGGTIPDNFSLQESHIEAPPHSPLLASSSPSYQLSPKSPRLAPKSPRLPPIVQQQQQLHKSPSRLSPPQTPEWSQQRSLPVQPKEEEVEDEELRRVLELSKMEVDQEEEKRRREVEEEEIVMRYVERMSKAEEEARRKARSKELDMRDKV